MKASNFMIVMDITHNKFNVYSEGGLLVQRSGFENIVKKFGNPIQVSANGKVFLFQKPELKKKVTVLEMIENKRKIEWKFIKQVDVQKCFDKFVEDYLQATAGTNDAVKGQ